MKTRNKTRLVMFLIVLSFPILIMIFGSDEDNFTILAFIGSVGLCCFYGGRFMTEYNKIEQNEFTETKGS